MEQERISESVIVSMLEGIVRECCRIEIRIESILDTKEGRDEARR